MLRIHRAHARRSFSAQARRAPSLFSAALLACGATLSACQSGPTLDACAQVPAAALNDALTIDSDAGSVRHCQLDPAQLTARVHVAGDDPVTLAVNGKPAAQNADGTFDLGLAPAVLALKPADLARSSRVALDLPITLGRGGDATPVTLHLGFGRSRVLAYFAGATRGGKLPTATANARALLLLEEFSPAVVGQAASLADVRYVVVRSERAEPTWTCGPYTTPDGHNFNVRSKALSSEVVIYDTLTGAEVGRHWFEQNLAAGPCPAEAVISGGNAAEGRDETREPKTSPEEIRSWLEQWAASR